MKPVFTNPLHASGSAPGTPRQEPSPAGGGMTAWIAGTLVAFLGVGLARGLAPHVAVPAQEVVAAIGRLLGMAGLFILALGVHRRVRRLAPNPLSNP